MLNHLDADKGVEGFLKVSGKVSVVPKVDKDSLSVTSGRDPFLGQRLLLDRERERVNAGGTESANCLK